MSTICGRVTASTAMQFHRRRKPPQQRLRLANSSKLSSVAFTSVSRKAVRLSLETDSTGTSGRRHEEKEEPLTSQTASKAPPLPPPHHGTAGGQSGSSDAKKLLSATKDAVALATQKGHVAQTSKRGGRDGTQRATPSITAKEKPHRRPAVRRSPVESTAKSTSPPRMSSMAAAVVSTEENRSFLSPAYAEDLSFSSSICNDSVGEERASTSHRDADATACVRAPFPACPPLTTDERHAVTRAFQTYQGSTAAALAEGGVVRLLRKLYETAHHNENQTTSAATGPSPSAAELLRQAERCFGTARFHEVMNSAASGARTLTGDSAAVRASFTLDDALLFAGVLKSERTSHSVKEWKLSNSLQRSMESPAATRIGGTGDDAEKTGSGVFTPSATAPRPATPTSAMEHPTSPHAARYLMHTKTSFSSVLTASPLTFLPSAVALHKPDVRSPDAATRRGAAPGSTSAPPSGEANCPDPSSPSFPLAGAAGGYSATPPAPSRGRADSVLCGDVALWSYVIRRAFAELAEGRQGAHRRVSFERLSEALQLFELRLNLATVLCVCDGVHVDEDGNIKGEQIDLATFEKIMEAGLQHPLDGGHIADKRKVYMQNTGGTADTEKDAVPVMFHLVLLTDIPSGVYAAGGTSVSTKSGEGGHVGGATTFPASQQRSSAIGGDVPPRDSLPQPTSGLAVGVAPYVSVSHSRSTSSLAASVASLTRSFSDTDDAYPVAVTQDSAIAALCREIRWRLRTAAHHSANDNAESKARETVSASGEEKARHGDVPSPPLPPPPPPPFPSTTAAACPRSSPSAWASISTSATASIPSSVYVPPLPVHRRPPGKVPTELLSISSSSASHTGVKANSSPNRQKSQEASRLRPLSPAKRLPSNSQAQSQPRYRHHSKLQQPSPLSTRHPMLPHQDLQRWPRKIASPPTVTPWTTPHPYGPAVTTATSTSVSPTTQDSGEDAPHHRSSSRKRNSNSHSSGTLSNTVGGDSSTDLRSPLSPHVPRYSTLSFSRTAKAVAHHPSRRTLRAAAAANGPVPLHSSSPSLEPSSSPTTASPARLPRSRQPRWEQISALSPYYVPRERSPPSRCAVRNSPGMSAQLAEASHVPERQPRLANEDFLRGPAHPPPPRQTLPPHRPPSASLSELSSPSFSAPSLEAVAATAPTTNPIVFTVPHSTVRPTRPSAAAAAAATAAGAASLPWSSPRPLQNPVPGGTAQQRWLSPPPPPPPSHAQQRPRRQRHNMFRDHQSREDGHLQLQADSCQAADVTALAQSSVPLSSHLVSNAANSAAPSGDSPPLLSPQQQRRQWVLSELAGLYVQHKSLTQHLAALSTVTSAFPPSYMLMLQLPLSALGASPSLFRRQAHQHEVLECEAALNDVSRLIHHYLAELALGCFLADDTSTKPRTSQRRARQSTASYGGPRGRAAGGQEAWEREGYLACAVAEAYQAASTAVEQTVCRLTSPLLCRSDIPSQPHERNAALAVEEARKTEKALHACAGSSPIKHTATALPSLDSNRPLSPKCIMENAANRQLGGSNSGSAGGAGEGGRPAHVRLASLRDSSIFSGPLDCGQQSIENSKMDSNYSTSSPSPHIMRASTVPPGADSVNSRLSQRPPLPATLILNDSGSTHTGPLEPLTVSVLHPAEQSTYAADSPKLFTALDEFAETIERPSRSSSADDGAESATSCALPPKGSTFCTNNVASGAHNAAAQATAETSAQHGSQTKEHKSTPTTLSKTSINPSLALPPLRTSPYSPIMKWPHDSHSPLSGPTNRKSFSSTVVAAAAAAVGLHGSAATPTATATLSGQGPNTTAAAMEAAEGMYDDDSPSPRANIYLEWAVTQLEQRQRLRQQQQRDSGVGNEDHDDYPAYASPASPANSFGARGKTTLMIPHLADNVSGNNGHAHSTSPASPFMTPMNGSWTAPRFFCSNTAGTRPPTGANRSTAGSGMALRNSLSASKRGSVASEAGLAGTLMERESHSWPSPRIAENDTLRSDDRPSNEPGSMTLLADESPLRGASARRSIAGTENSLSHIGLATTDHLGNTSFESTSVSQVSGISAPLEFFGSATWSTVVQSRTAGQVPRSGHSSTSYRMTRSTARIHGGSDNQRSHSLFEKTASSTMPAGFSGSIFPQRDADGNVMHDGN
ncbi:hemagglutinin-like protein [Leptomonas pyrrhocoris]|uniref:Hemagglutinin-like protein n=1 Tax=Leptomonas pyrrhocoris TaxID=157538 RepID=A0A0N0DVC1_LEPPY|nr:hemagglutinin-like protein [Leptomonas pyrrhocoris]XP_015658601.1 hemagglutinin-like protein [Leptomonas pyrrhocoris]KPA80161.1 hemagglutinin-like protein [Leptomonas pyrrhocoris]KPA80162.1 hemagglutinin-like protein [Leptomonas pyrrhocoris]|eukprot:XP_015658600.1 hemagglutinin-like protein [Leptomonas pyrrhocoris]